MSDIDVSLEIGKLQSEVAAVRRDNDRMAASLESIEADVRAMASTLDQARGGWRLIAAVAGASGLIGSIATAAWQWLSIHGHWR
jgi:N-acetylmuramic acid 6-phosphate (MurNAc-6-P) etherase